MVPCMHVCVPLHTNSLAGHSFMLFAVVELHVGSSMCTVCTQHNHPALCCGLMPAPGCEAGTAMQLVQRRSHGVFNMQ